MGLCEAGGGGGGGTEVPVEKGTREREKGGNTVRSMTIGTAGGLALCQLSLL